MEKKKFRSAIGGQAVLEGVMMRGERSMATAVRDENGNIQVESSRFTPASQKSKWKRLPFIRGVINFVNSMIMGVQIIMRSGEVFEGEEQPSKFENWYSKKFKINIMFHNLKWSRPARGGWIEITKKRAYRQNGTVSPREGRVD